MLEKDQLEKLYSKYTKRELVFPDPVGFLYDYEIPEDREIVGLVASSLAYGRVELINKTVASVLKEFKPSPYKFITQTTTKQIFDRFAGFKYRFTTGTELACLLRGIKEIIEECGSLEQYFLSCLKPDHESLFPAMCAFSGGLLKNSDLCRSSLVPCPEKGSACKRLSLFLRWVVRSDIIDPGGWDQVPASMLVMPIDTHIHRFSLAQKLTTRKNADMKTALEITAAFKKLSPEDPVKYDFCLTRASILQDPYILKALKKKSLPVT